VSVELATAGDLAGAPAAGAATAGLEAALALVRGARVSTLANGLTLCVVPSRRAPIVSTALWYRVGTGHEDPAVGGVAHFLEHMMFKGAQVYGPGDIDQATQRLGGANNAFTSHEATAYYFDFAADRWQEALAIEADRMRSLRLAAEDVESERQVILEEIAMYQDDPWDALEMAAHEAFFGSHPYGRPVLGTTETLAAISRDSLARFHDAFYRPAHAVLVVAGEVGSAAQAEDAVARWFGELPADAAPLPPVPPFAAPAGLRRIERRHGDVPRLMLLLPAPPASADEHALLKLGLTALAHGRASRLQRRLVDEGQLCAWVSADVTDGPLVGLTVVEAELLPGVEPERVEELVFAELERLASAPLDADELERARRIFLADWVFGHEGIHQQALALGSALALFDLRFPQRQLAATVGGHRGRDEDCAATTAALLRPAAGGLLAWSLPE
jgi:zinc protease